MNHQGEQDKRNSSRVILVTGGQRSGKSEFAEKMALSLSSTPVYLATAMITDDEMQKRVEIHKKRREKNWKNLEEPLLISGVELA